MSGVLISGVTQPLGAAVARRVLEGGGGPVLGVGVEPHERAADLLPAGVTYLRVDLTHTRRVRRLLNGPCRDLGITSVLHLASRRNATETGRKVHRLNVDVTRLMLRLAEEHPTIERFVHRSTSAVYHCRGREPDVMREDQPLDLDPAAPQWVRDRVEADVTVCARMGLAPIRVLVLRCAEILAADMGSQLYDYLGSRVCLRPIGFDPLVELLSVADAARACELALRSDAQGAFNIGGADVLPLSRVIRNWGRDDVPLPGPLLGPLYRARAALRRTDFRYDLNKWRLHFNGVLDGTRAREVFGYRPEHPIVWPKPAPLPSPPTG
jgi:UDP-glucose 4-epimerase